MSVTIIPDVMQDMAEQTYRQQVYIVADTQMHTPPWLFEEEGWEKSRLKAAIELVCTGKVTESLKGWSVAGSKTPYFLYRDTMACPCKAAEHGKTGVCKHRVAVELQRRVQQAYPQNTSLPLPPVTVDERLAQAAAVARDHVFDALPTPEEDRMTDDEYIHEGDDHDTPTAIVERPATAAVPRPLPGPVLLPSLDARTLEQSMQAWAEQRQVVKRFIQTQLVDGTDYYTLQMGQRTSKPTLSKAGSEKFLGLFQLHATFTQDTATWTMLGEPKGTLCYVCHLLTRSGEVVSEGRGAREVLKEKDINKAIKMAQKSAQIDAVLRTGALSEAFTQDINDEDDQPVPGGTPTKLTSAELRKRIWAHVYKAAPHVKTQDAAMVWVEESTGLTMEPDHYADILRHLEEGP